MKNFITKTSLFLAAIVSSGNISAQSDLLIDDFEGGDKGWITISCYNDIRANKYMEGINTSNHVLFTKRGTTDDNWSGAMLPDSNLAGSPITGYRYLHAKMYRNNTNMPNLKISGSGSDLLPMPEITIVANQWQDVVFDVGMLSVENVFFMVDRSELLATEAWMLVDDIILSNDPEPRTEEGSPVVPAKPGTPIHDPSEVQSIYCSAYTNMTGINYNPWGVPAKVNPNFVIEDTEVLQYKNLDYQGTEFPDLDVTDMSYLHVEVWSSMAFTPNISLIDHVSYIEKSYPLPLTANQWNLFDIPLTAFEMPQNAIWQLKFDNGDENTIYIANWYFYKDMLTDVNIKYADKLVVFVVNGKLCVSGSGEEVTVYNALGKIIYKSVPAENLSVELAKGLYIIKEGTTTAKVLIK